MQQKNVQMSLKIIVIDIYKIVKINVMICIEFFIMTVCRQAIISIIHTLRGKLIIPKRIYTNG